jgi:hypothetical protein
LRFWGFCLVNIATGGRPDLSIIAPERWAARLSMDFQGKCFAS